jgi:uncharacterized membrane protein (UPF0136 family)
MKSVGIITLFYGLLILLGGVMGHIKAASTASLYTGIVFGLLAILLSFGIFKKSLLSAYFAILLTFILDAFFTYRLLLTMKFMPAGMMAVISTIVLILQASLIKKSLSNK